MEERWELEVLGSLVQNYCKVVGKWSVLSVGVVVALENETSLSLQKTD